MALGVISAICAIVHEPLCIGANGICCRNMGESFSKTKPYIILCNFGCVLFPKRIIRTIGSCSRSDGDSCISHGGELCSRELGIKRIF